MSNLDKTKSMEDKSKEREYDGTIQKAAAGLSATEAAYTATQKASIEYSKPDTYTGHRELFDSGAAKVDAKNKAFSGLTKVIDPYTGNELTLTKKEAKLKYGNDWQNHLAESDHIKPLAKVFEDTKRNVWNTTDDIKEAANSEENVRVVSRKYNNAKRGKTNKEFVEDEEYITSKEVPLTSEGKERAIQDGESAEKSINGKLRKAGIKNAVKTGHEAGVSGAISAGGTALTVSTILNVTAVLRGEKSGEEAIKDIAMDGGKAAASGYVMSGGLTVVSHTLSGSSSAFLQGLAESNVPGKIITAVIVTGDTLKKWGEGDITTQECVIELADKGLNVAITGYAMAAGQALIPIPVVGAAIGALVGTALTSSHIKELHSALMEADLAHKERLRIEAECEEAIIMLKGYQDEIKAIGSKYRSENITVFDECIDAMDAAIIENDADGFIRANVSLQKQLGRKPQFNSMEEFELIMDSPDVPLKL